MALITCRDCEKEISERAYFCQHCGGLTKFGYPAFISLGLIGGLTGLALVKYVFLGP